MPYPPLVIYGAVITTPDEYRKVQQRALAKVRLVAKKATANPPVVAYSTALRVKCPCGNYPIVVADWKLACCLNCGLVYEGLDVPEDVA